MATVPADVQGPSDAELIESVRGGTIDAYGQLYERHVAAAYNLARQLARSQAEADDLVSEAFAKVLDTLRAGRGPDSAFRAYLLTALRHTAYDKTRRDKKVDLTEDMTDVAPPVAFSDTAVAGLERSLAARAFAALPERWQMVLWHTEIEGQSPAEVAPLLGLTANGVSALAYRAREGLKQQYLQMHLAETDDGTLQGDRRQARRLDPRGPVQAGGDPGRGAPRRVRPVPGTGRRARGRQRRAADLRRAARARRRRHDLPGDRGHDHGRGRRWCRRGRCGRRRRLDPPPADHGRWFRRRGGRRRRDRADRGWWRPAVPAGAGRRTAATSPDPGRAASRTAARGAAAVADHTPPPPPPPQVPSPSPTTPAPPPEPPAPQPPPPASLTPTVPIGFTLTPGEEAKDLPITVRNTGGTAAPPAAMTLTLPPGVLSTGGPASFAARLLQPDGATDQTVNCPAGGGTITCTTPQGIAPERAGDVPLPAARDARGDQRHDQRLDQRGHRDLRQHQRRRRGAAGERRHRAHRVDLARGALGPTRGRDRCATRARGRAR